MKDDLVQYLDDTVNEACDLIQSHIVSGVMDQDLIDAIGYLDYRGALPAHTFNYSDDLVNAVYFIKYGYAYAYEYHVMYDLILDSYLATQGRIFGVTCLGCGSLIDAWSLAYSKARLIEDDGKTYLDDLELRSIGNDLEEWAIRFISEPGNVMESAYPAKDNPRYPGAAKNAARDIVAFFDQESWYASYNTMFFSKILYELPATVLNDLIDSIRDKAINGKFTHNEYYICISHSKYRYETDARMKSIAGEIADAINTNGEFDITDDLLDTVGFLGTINDPGDLKCYAAVRNNHFPYDFSEIVGLEDLRIMIKNDLKASPRSTSYGKTVRDFRYINTTSQICLQVLKLTRRNMAQGDTEE